jgi:hypothetical protein
MAFRLPQKSTVSALLMVAMGEFGTPGQMGMVISTFPFPELKARALFRFTPPLKEPPPPPK